MDKETSKTRNPIRWAVDELFENPSISTEIAQFYLNQLHLNLTDIEKSLQRDYGFMILFFLGFLLFDTGIISQLTIQGAELKRSGLVMVLFPVFIAFLNYQASCRIVFIHDIRTTIALLYGKLKDTFYTRGLDLLTHYATIRNIESYQSMLVRSNSSKVLSKIPTFLVFLIMWTGPLLAIAYSLYRAWHYNDLPFTIMIISSFISLIFSLRSLTMLSLYIPEDPYVVRSRKNLNQL